MTPGEALIEACHTTRRHSAPLRAVELARRLGYTAKHISQVLHDKAPISADMALRLEFVLEHPARYWLSLQCQYDLTRARISDWSRSVRKLYQHPGDAYHVLRVYRSFLIGQKRKWMASGTRGRRCLRALVHYRDLVQEQRAAQRVVLAKIRKLLMVLRHIERLKRNAVTNDQYTGER
jgi:addiction module HigA family antidote